MFFGVYVIISEGFEKNFSFQGGEKYVMLSVFSQSLATNIFKKYMKKIDPEEVVLIRNSFGVIILLVIFSILIPLEHKFPAIENILTFKFLGILCLFSLCSIMLAQYFWYKSLEMIPATIASSTNLAQPLFGILLSVIILNESLNLFHIYGGLFIFIGFILTVYHHQSHPKHRRYLRFRFWFH